MAQEALARPDMLQDLVGWFPVHPDLYYRMRIASSSAELAAHPANLELYDDIAVAYDRLGDDAHALEVIEQKKAKLTRSGIKPVTSKKSLDPDLYGDDLAATASKSSRDPWYRYYANAGTFRIHRWIRAGRPKSHRDWIDQAQRDIDRAIEINPYAHELREFAQADVIRWLREGKPGQSLSKFMSQDGNAETDQKVRALAGLVELGGAWESVDVYEAIAHLETDDFSRIAQLRVFELQRLGKRSLTGHIFVPSDFHPSNSESNLIGPKTDDEYKLLRKASEDYRSYRIGYELTRLQAGRHPDSDPHFYDDFKERKLPEFGMYPQGYYAWYFTFGPGWLAIPSILEIICVFLIWPKKRNRLSPHANQS